MKLATLKTSRRDGQLVVVDRALTRCRAVPDISPHLQFAMDHWDDLSPRLEGVYAELNAGIGPSQPFSAAACAAPLPRAYQFVDGSAYLNHVQLVRRARGATVPDYYHTDPLMYQGGSDSLLGACDEVWAREADGIDFEAELAVVTGDLALGSDAAACARSIRLVMLMNDVSLRNLIPNEMRKEMGLIQAKPASSFSPVAVTPDELGDAWRDSKVHLPMRVHLNGEPFGKANAGEAVAFNFAQLIAHLSRTRRVQAGSIVGGGTSGSNEKKNREETDFEIHAGTKTETIVDPKGMPTMIAVSVSSYSTDCGFTPTSRTISSNRSGQLRSRRFRIERFTAIVNRSVR